MLLKNDRRERCSKDAFVLFIPPRYIILTLAAAAHDERRGGFRGRETAAAASCLPGGRIPSREISISGPAAIAARRPGVRRRETRRKNTCNRTPVFLFREWEPLPLSRSSSPPLRRYPPRNFAPEGTGRFTGSHHHPSFTNTKLSGIKGTLDTVGGTMSRGRS